MEKLIDKILKVVVCVIIAAAIVAVCAVIFAFIGAEFNNESAIRLRDWILVNIESISLATVCGALTTFFTFLRTAKDDNKQVMAKQNETIAEQKAATAEVVELKGALITAIDALNAATAQNAEMREQINKLETKLDAVYATNEYLTLKNSNDPLAKETEAVKKVDAYIEQKQAKDAERAVEREKRLTVSKRV
jgi:hypothetical protein